MRTLWIMVMAAAPVWAGGGAVETAMPFPAALEARLSHPAMPAGVARTVYLRVGLTGRRASDADRAPVNVAFVMDKSGSMRGQPMAMVRQALLGAVGRLGRGDVISVIAYDDQVDVVVPATRLTDPAAVEERIRHLAPGGETALFAGIAAGIAQLRKFHTPDRASRLVVLSDGLANIGPGTRGELRQLGCSLAKEQISVTTFGLGLKYAEDPLLAFADGGTGHHAFVPDAKSLPAVFDHEIDSLLSIAAQAVEVEVRFLSGARPVRALGRPAELLADSAYARIGQLPAEREKVLLLEVAIPSRPPADAVPLADVNARLRTLGGETVTDRVRVVAGFVEAPSAPAPDRTVMEEAVLQIANGFNQQALALRDAGQVDQARKILDGNGVFLSRQNFVLNSERIVKQFTANRAAIQNLQDNWEFQRKVMRHQEHALDQQQGF